MHQHHNIMGFGLIFGTSIFTGIDHAYNVSYHFLLDLPHRFLALTCGSHNSYTLPAT